MLNKAKTLQPLADISRLSNEKMVTYTKRTDKMWRNTDREQEDFILC